MTDRDAGVDADESVSVAGVFTEFARNVDALRARLSAVVADLPIEQTGCSCAAALDGTALPLDVP